MTGFGGLSNPQPGTAVAEALRKGHRGEIEIHALVYDSMMTGAWMPGVADFLHLVPPLHFGTDATLDRLADIREEFELDAIIPCLTLELPFYAGLADQLARVGIKIMLPQVSSIEAAFKIQLPQMAYSFGWPTPRTIHVGDMTNVCFHAEQFGFPLMVKGTVLGAIRVNSVEHVQEAALRLNRISGGGVLLQEILTGDQICVCAVVARNGEPIALASMQKLGLNSDGQATLGAVIDDPKIEEQARRIIRKLDWCGPLELEFIRSHRSDTPYLVQVNGRFPSWILLTHMAGSNLPETLLHELLESRIAKPAKPKPGTMFVRHVRETIVPLERLQALERHGLARPPRRTSRTGRRAKVREANEIRVAVTGLGNFDVVNPGLGAASAIRRTDEVSRIIGLGYGTYESGMYDRRIFDAVYRLPEREDPEALFGRLREIHSASPFDMILPCLDGEIPRFIEIKDALEAIGIRTLLPSKEAFDARTKKSLFVGKMERLWGAFEIPKSVLVRSPQELGSAIEELGLPIIVKGLVSEAIRANSLTEARAAWLRLRASGNSEVIVQPMIEGDHFAVSTVCNREFDALQPLTIKKLTMCHRGSTWGALHAPQPRLETDFARLLKEIQWCGPTEGEFIRDWRQETFHLIEVNPRFTAWNCFTADLGANQAFQAVCLALGRPFPIEAGGECPDAVFMRSSVEIPASVLDFAAVATKGRLENVG